MYWFESDCFTRYSTDLRQIFTTASVSGVDDCASDSALLTIVRVYKLYLLTYLLTYLLLNGVAIAQGTLPWQSIFVIQSTHFFVTVTSV